MNSLIGNKYISVEGKDNALKIAAVLIEQDYQVFIQLDDCNIYIIAYTNNNTRYGGDEFALLNDDEYQLIVDYRFDKEEKAAIDRVKELIHEGVITDEDLGLHK